MHIAYIYIHEKVTLPRYFVAIIVYQTLWNEVLIQTIFFNNTFGIRHIIP